MVIKTRRIHHYIKKTKMTKSEIQSSLHEQRLTFERKRKTISINLNQSNHCYFCSFNRKDLVCINYLLSPFFYAVISVYSSTQKSQNYVLNKFLSE